MVAGPEFTESLGGTWYEGSITSVAIGQESTQVTPVQLTNYISTLVNGGTRYSTHLLKEVKFPATSPRWSMSISPRSRRSWTSSPRTWRR